jgi:hypothetical protein
MSKLPWRIESLKWTVGVEFVFQESATQWLSSTNLSNSIHESVITNLTDRPVSHGSASTQFVYGSRRKRMKIFHTHSVSYQVWFHDWIRDYSMRSRLMITMEKRLIVCCVVLEVWKNKGGINLIGYPLSLSNG